MSLDTTALNQQIGHFEDHASVWLFGYGSLIFKADFPYLECRPAHIQDWTRRFWQGSHDHRGTQTAPGRVVTLIPQQGSTCAGMAYLITPEVFSHLDYREKNGYLRTPIPLHFADGSSVMGLLYIATEDNAAFLGLASEADIAAQIASASGPSGPNRDYLLQLAEALRALGQIDDHVFTIERELKAILHQE